MLDVAGSRAKPAAYVTHNQRETGSAATQHTSSPGGNQGSLAGAQPIFLARDNEAS